jgi:CDP-diacylglycerol--glycerol-3-phosphate 3-phosphatidyltransferase
MLRAHGDRLSIYALKPRFQALLRPIARRLFAAGVTANQVTIAACAVSIAIGAFLGWHPENWRAFLLVPAWLFIRMALNALDGMLAREFGQASKLGAYLNEITDVVADAALYAPFAWLPGSSPLLVAAIIALAIISEMAGVLGATVGASRRYDGPMGKSDRAFVFGMVGLLVGLGIDPGGFLPWILVAVAALIGLTIFNRVRSGLREAT